MVINFDPNIFKDDYTNIILENEKILYDDNFMFIFSGKTYKLKLTNIKKNKTIKYQYIDQSPINSFEARSVNIFSEYKQLLILAKKIISNFIVESKKYDLYDENDRYMYLIFYLKNKYFLDKKIILIHLDNNKKYIETKKKQASQLLASNLITKFINDYDIDLNVSFHISYGFAVAIYNYDSFVKFFIDIYNKIIKLPLSNNCISIELRTDYCVELIFDIITSLRYYYEEIIIIKTKYTSRYNLILILKNKINKYDKKHKITYKNNLYRLYNKKIPQEYVDLMNKLYKNRSLIIKTIMYINTLNDDYKKLILEKIKIYREANDEILKNQIKNSIY